MTERNRLEHDYSLALLIITASTGAIDCVSYLALDRVFTGNMTGDVLFLGFGLPGVQSVPACEQLGRAAHFHARRRGSFAHHPPQRR